MKKVINIITLMTLVILFICNSVYATSITLEQIVEKFNKSSIVDDYKNTGGSISATNNANSINITVNANGKTENVELLLQGNILSIEINQEDEDAFTKAYVASSVIDIIGQLHGYQEGELSQTINSDKAKNYTLEKEGYEAENISETKFKIKVDITKKIPLVDFSNTYIEVSDLQDLKKYISGDGSAETSKGNIWFNKSGYEGEYTLLVAEKGNLTENTYKSVLSILEVMFDNDKVIQHFKNNYPNISTGDKEFKGFNIKVNPKEKTQREESLIPTDSGYEFVRIVIDKSLAISSTNETEKVEGGTPNKDNTQTQVENKIDIDTLPRTGEETNVFLIILYILVGTCSFALIVLLLTKMKRK